MTSTEWTGCNNPVAMVKMLKGLMKLPSDRKLRLFCYNHLKADLPWRNWNKKYADQTVHELEAWIEEGTLPPRGSWDKPPSGSGKLCGMDMALNLADRGVSREKGSAVFGFTPKDGNVAILRCLFGDDPSKPSSRSWFEFIEALNPEVYQALQVLALTAYWHNNNEDGTLCGTAISHLAGGLRLAGCTNEELVKHLEGPTPHYRGCWAVDLVLGKE